jgi:hypothetical protein
MAEINEGFDQPAEYDADQGFDSDKNKLPTQPTGLRVHGATVSYHNLQYTVEVPGKCWGKTTKQILFGVR